jgi:hypothetical protein
VYVVAPLFVLYRTDTVRTRTGERLPIDAQVTTAAYGGGLNIVMSKKLLGGFYGFEVLFPVGMNNRLQGIFVPTGRYTDGADDNTTW